MVDLGAPRHVTAVLCRGPLPWHYSVYYGPSSMRVEDAATGRILCNKENLTNMPEIKLLLRMGQFEFQALRPTFEIPTSEFNVRRPTF